MIQPCPISVKGQLVLPRPSAHTGGRPRYGPSGVARGGLNIRGNAEVSVKPTVHGPVLHGRRSRRNLRGQLEALRGELSPSATLKGVAVERERTLLKVKSYVEQAAGQGCHMVVFGEALVPGVSVLVGTRDVRSGLRS